MVIANWEERLVHEASDQDVARDVAHAIGALFAADTALFIRNVNERTITGHFAAHLRRRFIDWDVDCEYNRDGHVVKKADGVIVVPDIIVHRRGTADNLLVVEVKKSNSRVSDAVDLQKLAAFRESHLRYRQGLFLKLVVGASAPGVMRLQWI